MALDQDSYDCEVRGTTRNSLEKQALGLAAAYFGCEVHELQALPFMAQPTSVMETNEGGWHPSSIVTAFVTVIKTTEPV